MRVILGIGDFPNKAVDIQIGGSKSESNRLLLLKAQFPNISIENLSESDDTKVLLKGLETSKGTIDVHHAGTAMRFLTAYFAANEGSEITLTGSQRMQERPIGVLVEALKSLGTDIEYLQEEGFPPLRINGRILRKREVKIQANVSSQFISALMLIAPMIPGGIRIILTGEILSKPYIGMTLSLLDRIGVDVNFDCNRIDISPKKEIEDIEIVVESDWSSASYFYSLVALSLDMEMTLRNFSKNSLQGDSILPSIYKILGVRTVFHTEEGTIFISKENVQLPEMVHLDLSDTPDLAQTLAVTCYGLGIGCRITGLKTLKIKETDRLSALKNELSKFGARIYTDENSLQLEKNSSIHPNITVETYQDHRMAMAFAPLAVKTNLTILNAGVVSKSYPDFWNDLRKTGISCEFPEF